MMAEQYELYPVPIANLRPPLLLNQSSIRCKPQTCDGIIDSMGLRVYTISL